MEWENDSYLMPNQQTFSYIIDRTSYIRWDDDDDDIRFVLIWIVTSLKDVRMLGWFAWKCLNVSVPNLKMFLWFSWTCWNVSDLPENVEMFLICLKMLKYFWFLWKCWNVSVLHLKMFLWFSWKCWNISDLTENVEIFLICLKMLECLTDLHDILHVRNTIKL